MDSIALVAPAQHVAPALARVDSVHSMRDIPFATPPSEISAHNHSHSSLGELTDMSSRLVSLNISQSLAGDTSARPKHSSVIRIDDLHSLHKTRQRLESQIQERGGPLSINAIILCSLYERLIDGLNDATLHLFTSEDPTQFINVYYPLRDVFHHLQCIGPVGNCLPRASRLSQLIKWDFRQLINSFLTLMRTSPGFVATAFSELGPVERKLFIGSSSIPAPGSRADLVEEVMCGQRLSPLGILFHGLLRDDKQRVNYLAAMSAQLLLDDHDQAEQTILAIMNKFSKEAFAGKSPKLDLFLRKLIKSGQTASFSGGPGAGSTTTTTASLSITTYDEFWEPTVKKLLELLMEYIAPNFALFVATLAVTASPVAHRVYAMALSHYKQWIRTLLTTPHAFRLLEDHYVSEQTQKLLLLPLATMACSAIDTNEQFKSRLFAQGVDLGDIHCYYENNQLIVLSLSDITFLYSSLLPARRGSPIARFEEEDNEWCLDNIRADLEPVMKELSVRLPGNGGRTRAIKEQGIFMEFWQVFKIEQDGLVNDMDSQNWCPSSCPEIVLEGGDIGSILANSIDEAEARGAFVESAALRRIAASANPLNLLVTDLDRCVQILTAHLNELTSIVEQHTQRFYKLQRTIATFEESCTACRAYVWYELEVRGSPQYLRVQEVVNFLKGELGLQRSNSSSSHHSRRYSARPRRLSILSSASVVDSFFVSKDYLLKPKLADREIEMTLKYLRSRRVQNFCRSEELIHRSNCEINSLLTKIFERDFLNLSVCYKRDLKNPVGNSSHRMSMSVLPDLSTSRSRSRKSSPNLLLDIFEWKSSDRNGSEWSMGLEASGSSLPDRDLICGLVLSDLSIEMRSETDEFMQQTGRMLLDGDGQIIQPILEHISMQMRPKAKLAGFESLVQVVRNQLEAETDGHQQQQGASRHDVTYELSKLFGREPGTLYTDLQTVVGFVPASAPELDAGQPFWDAAEAALKTLDQVVGKSMDLATRMLKYNETNKSSTLVNTMGVNDAVAIWSFCARNGRPKAQRKLAELYLAYPNTLLEVLAFTKPAILFEGIEPAQARSAVVAHWMQAAAQKGDPRAAEYCRQLKSDFI